MALKNENYLKNQPVPVGETWAGEQEIDLRQASFTFALIDEVPGVACGLGERLAKRLGIPSSRARAAVTPGLFELRNAIATALQRAFIESQEWSQQSERQSRFRLLTLDQAELAARIPCRGQEESCLSLSPELASELNIPLWILRGFLRSRDSEESVLHHGLESLSLLSSKRFLNRGASKTQKQSRWWMITL